ncbi:MAG TPA: FAD-dependent oxidoreductase [Streptosporangiaceae bacterium]|nr:FAD-dependent oxidoreductase [Streptosporangiaceae bacterium]
MRRPRIVVIGGGAGSAAAVAELRKQGFDGSLTLVSAENTVPYERPPLSKGFLLGTSGQVPVKDAAWYEQASVELILGSRATRLDLAARTVTLSGGAVLGYDRLLLATGVRPRVLPGLDGDGVCYLRTGEDAAALRDKMTAAGHVAVLGGGFIGCEVAAAAIRLGKRATILEALPTLLHRALGPELGDIVAGIHRDEGVDVRTGQQVLGVRPRPGGGVQLSTAAGDVGADVLVVGVGTVPNTELAEQAGLPAGHGIEVDECFATAAPGIYAIGDVAAQHLPGHGRRVRVEHHDTALRHGRVAARNMLGHREPFGDVHWFWSDQFDHTISSAGLIPESDGTGELVIRGSLEQRSFSAFSLDGDRVRAVISLNRPRDVLDARRLIARDHSATAGQLRDESLPLKRLAAPAVTAT